MADLQKYQQKLPWAAVDL